MTPIPWLDHPLTASKTVCGQIPEQCGAPLQQPCVPIVEPQVQVMTTAPNPKGLMACSTTGNIVSIAYPVHLGLCMLAYDVRVGACLLMCPQPIPCGVQRQHGNAFPRSSSRPRSAPSGKMLLNGDLSQLICSSISSRWSDVLRCLVLCCLNSTQASGWETHIDSPQTTAHRQTVCHKYRQWMLGFVL